MPPTTTDPVQHFYVADGDRLIPLTSFSQIEGQSHVVRVPTFGGNVYGRTRRAPDTFQLSARAILPQEQRFLVVDETCHVYDCLGMHFSLTQGQSTIGGILLGHQDVNEAQRADAARVIDNAIRQGNDQ